MKNIPTKYAVRRVIKDELIMKKYLKNQYILRNQKKIVCLNILHLPIVKYTEAHLNLIKCL